MPLPFLRGQSAQKKAKNLCRICKLAVTDKSGIQCKGLCACWLHFKCLGYSAGKILNITQGKITVVCPCPNCCPSANDLNSTNPINERPNTIAASSPATKPAAIKNSRSLTGVTIKPATITTSRSVTIPFTQSIIANTRPATTPTTITTKRSITAATTGKPTVSPTKPVTVPNAVNTSRPSSAPYNRKTTTPSSIQTTIVTSPTTKYTTNTNTISTKKPDTRPAAITTTTSIIEDDTVPTFRQTTKTSKVAPTRPAKISISRHIIVPSKRPTTTSKPIQYNTKAFENLPNYKQVNAENENNEEELEEVECPRIVTASTRPATISSSRHNKEPTKRPTAKSKYKQANTEKENVEELDEVEYPRVVIASTRPAIISTSRHNIVLSKRPTETSKPKQYNAASFEKLQNYKLVNAEKEKVVEELEEVEYPRVITASTRPATISTSRHNREPTKRPTAKSKYKQANAEKEKVMKELEEVKYPRVITASTRPATISTSRHNKEPTKRPTAKSKPIQYNATAFEKLQNYKLVNAEKEKVVEELEEVEYPRIVIASTRPAIIATSRHNIVPTKRPTAISKPAEKGKIVEELEEVKYPRVITASPRPATISTSRHNKVPAKRPIATSKLIQYNANNTMAFETLQNYKLVNAEKEKVEEELEGVEDTRVVTRKCEAKTGNNYRISPESRSEYLAEIRETRNVGTTRIESRHIPRYANQGV